LSSNDLKESDVTQPRQMQNEERKANKESSLVSEAMALMSPFSVPRELSVADLEGGGV